MDFGFLLAACVGGLLAVLVLASFGRTTRSKEGTFSGGALAFLGSASLSSFVLIAAFLIAGSWANLNTARSHTLDEARALNAAYTDADPHTRPLLHAYVTSVIDSEWATMTHGQASPVSWQRLDAVRAQVEAEPASPLRDQELTDLNGVYTARQIRLADTGATMPWPLYPALICTGLLVLLYAPIAGLTFHRREAVALGLVGAVVGFGIWMVLHMTHPYTGPVHVTPAAYSQSLIRFEQLGSVQTVAAPAHGSAAAHH